MILPAAPPPQQAGLRHVYACSDIHTDHEENMAWVRALDDGRFRSDVLLVAGDVSNSLCTFCETMETLTLAFGLVFFVTGNHDLWMRSEDVSSDQPYVHSLEKLDRLEEACERLGVVTTAQSVQLRSGRITIAPLLSFYHAQFDTEPAITAMRMPSVKAAVTDYRACRWPAPLEIGAFCALQSGRKKRWRARSMAWFPGRRGTHASRLHIRSSFRGFTGVPDVWQIA